VREIKFRAWDKKRKEYFHISKMWNGGTGLSCFSADGWVGNYGNRGNMNDIVLEQFTGLHDKNGKEVYEGDILKYLSFEEKTYYLPVFYSAEDASFQMGWVKTIYATHYGEVVGNIHENKKLVEE
jgi:uncharacterized phage protein (TIGR01671 family)